MAFRFIYFSPPTLGLRQVPLGLGGISGLRAEHSHAETWRVLPGSPGARFRLLAVERAQNR